MIYEKKMNNFIHTKTYHDISNNIASDIPVYYTHHTGIIISDSNIEYIIYAEKNKYKGMDIDFNGKDISTMIDEYYTSKIGTEYLTLHVYVLNKENIEYYKTIESHPKFNEWLCA